METETTFLQESPLKPKTTPEPITTPIQEKQEPTPGTAEPETIKIDLNDILSDYEEPIPVPGQIPTPPEEVTNKLPLSMFINGYLLLIIYDKFYPSILKFILRTFAKTDIKTDLHLSEEEIKILEPIADKVVKELNLEMHPFVAFFVISNIFYLSKIDGQAPTELKENTTPKEAPTTRKPLCKCSEYYVKKGHQKKCHLHKPTTPEA